MGFAEGSLDLKKNCSITIEACGSEDTELAADVEEANVYTDLYLVARAVKDSMYDTYSFELTDRFMDIGVIPERPDADQWKELAEKAGEILFSDLSGSGPDAEGMAGTEIDLSEPGLYLAVAHGKDLEEYLVEEQTEEGSTVTLTAAYSKSYQYLYGPELIAVPSKEPDENGVINTANKGDWMYDVTAVLKPEQRPNLGKLEIVKDLLKYNVKEAVSFVFEAEISYKEKQLPSRIVMITFENAEKRSVILEDIPVGAEVTVSEIYSGLTYRLMSADSQSGIINAEEILTVSFDNEYDDRDGGSTGILNMFDYNEETGWQWNGGSADSGSSIYKETAANSGEDES